MYMYALFNARFLDRNGNTRFTIKEIEKMKQQTQNVL